MEEEIQALADHVETIVARSQRLADEVTRLRVELEAARRLNNDLRARMNEARVRVEAALANLPQSTELEG